MASNRIKEVMRDKGMSHLIPNDHVLKELGVKKHSWTKWVDKTTDPDFNQVPIIAKFLGCDIEDLFPREGEESGISDKHKLLS